MVVALLVSTPAIFAQIIFAAQGRERLRNIGNFTDDGLRLLERFYLTEAAESTISTAAAQTMNTEKEVEETVEEDLETSYAREETAPAFELDEQESLPEDFAETAEVAEAPEEAMADFVEHHELPEQEHEEEAVVPVPIGMIVDESATSDLIQEEMPLSEIESPFEAVEEGFIDSDEEEVQAEEEPEPAGRRNFNTPFAEPEINPIAQQTAGILARTSA